MPPKKKGAAEEELPMLMGRLSTNIKIGIVGLPNVGYVLINKNVIAVAVIRLSFKHIHVFKDPTQIHSFYILNL